LGFSWPMFRDLVTDTSVLYVHEAAANFYCGGIVWEFNAESQVDLVPGNIIPEQEVDTRGRVFLLFRYYGKITRLVVNWFC